MSNTPSQINRFQLDPIPGPRRLNQVAALPHSGEPRCQKNAVQFYEEREEDECEEDEATFIDDLKSLHPY
jgi:hypothetical protein